MRHKRFWQKFLDMKNKLYIVKIGGNVLNDPTTLIQLLHDFLQLDGQKILVHGGGKKATELATKLGVNSQMIEGRRVTDLESLEIATMVYAGLINTNLVAQIQAMNQMAIGLSGADFSLLLAKKREVDKIDYGFVGDVVTVNKDPLNLLLNAGMIPVVCALSHDGNGQLLNTNADTVAAELAKALSKDFEVELNYVFEKNGVFLNVEDEGSKCASLSQMDCVDLVQKQLIFDGMLPKLKNCFEAKKAGVEHVRVGGVQSLLHPEEFSTEIKLS